MASILVRNLDDDVQRRLKRRAAAHGRSMEAEVRAILADAVAEPGLVAAWLSLAESVRESDEPQADFAVPERSQPREIDFS